MSLRLPEEVKELPEERVKQRESQGFSPLTPMVLTDNYGFINVAKYKDFAERIYNFQFRPDDVVIRAFPRSGTLWTVELVWALRHADQLDVKQKLQTSDRAFLIDDVFLDILNTDKARQRLAEERPGTKTEEAVTLQLAEAATTPRIIWTHLPLHLLHPDMLKTCKVVLVVRNPKDACLSGYYMHKYFGDRFFSGTFESFCDGFMSDNVTYSPYWPYIRQARQQKDNPNCHMMFYEDMKADIMGELRKLSGFLGLQLGDEVLRKVAEYAQFERMKPNPVQRMEFKSFVGDHCRKGQVGDWFNVASPEVDAKMNRWIEENSKDLDFAFRFK